MNPTQEALGRPIQPTANPAKLSEEMVAPFHALANPANPRLSLAPRGGLQPEALRGAVRSHWLRQALAATGTTVPNQTGRPTQHLTMCGVFQFFAAIHVLLIEGQRAMVLNLTSS